MKKRILSLLLCAIMILSLLPSAFAADETDQPGEQPNEQPDEQPADGELTINIRKTVEQGGTVAPPEKTFTFELTHEDEGHGTTPEDYGLSVGELKILPEDFDDNGVAVKEFPVVYDEDKIGKSGWKTYPDGAQHDIATFYLSEKDDGDKNWTYDKNTYACDFIYNWGTNTIESIKFRKIGNDEEANTDACDFTNTYTENLSLEIHKTVKQGGNVAPPAEDFTFELTDSDEENPRTPEEYGLIFDELKIPTDGAGEYKKNFVINFDLDKVTPENGWEDLTNSGTDDVYGYGKTFYLGEKDDGEENWIYDKDKFACSFTYYPEGEKQEEHFTVVIHEIGNDADTAYAPFANTYTAEKEEPDVPKTGGDSRIALWITMGTISLCGLAALLIISKKKNRNGCSE